MSILCTFCPCPLDWIPSLFILSFSFLLTKQQERCEQCLLFPFPKAEECRPWQLQNFYTGCSRQQTGGGRGRRAFVLKLCFLRQLGLSVVAAIACRGCGYYGSWTCLSCGYWSSPNSGDLCCTDLKGQKAVHSISLCQIFVPALFTPPTSNLLCSLPPLTRKA